MRERGSVLIKPKLHTQESYKTFFSAAHSSSKMTVTLSLCFQTLVSEDGPVPPQEATQACGSRWCHPGLAHRAGVKNAVERIVEKTNVSFI